VRYKKKGENVEIGEGTKGKKVKSLFIQEREKERPLRG